MEISCVFFAAHAYLHSHAYKYAGYNEQNTAHVDAFLYELDAGTCDLTLLLRHFLRFFFSPLHLLLIIMLWSIYIIIFVVAVTVAVIINFFLITG